MNTNKHTADYWLNANVGFFNLGDLHIGDSAEKVLEVVAAFDPAVVESYPRNYGNAFIYKLNNSIELTIDLEDKTLLKIGLDNQFKGKFVGEIAIGNTLKPFLYWGLINLIGFRFSALIMKTWRGTSLVTEMDEDTFGNANGIYDILREPLCAMYIRDYNYIEQPKNEDHLCDWFKWFVAPVYRDSIPPLLVEECQKLCIFQMDRLDSSIYFETALKEVPAHLWSLPPVLIQSFFNNWLRQDPTLKEDRVLDAYAYIDLAPDEDKSYWFDWVEEWSK